MEILQQQRQLRRCFDGIQDDRNHRTFPLDELVEKSLNLGPLPRANATFSHKDRGRFYHFYLLFKRRLPRGSRPDFHFIQPGLDAFLDQLLPDLANGGLVLAVVAQEDIKDFRFGLLCVHKAGLC
jgi:hypothetical protein